MRRFGLAIISLSAYLQAFSVFAVAPEFATDADNAAQTEDVKTQDHANAATTVNADSSQLLRAQIKARESTQIASEMAGKISYLKIRDGERFKAGQLLVGFNCSQEEAQLKKSKATLDKKQKTHQVNQKLASLKSISTLEVDVARAEESEAKADVQVAEAILDKCTIKAPFSGKVVDVTARAYQSVRPGDPLLEIISEKDLEIEFIAPSKSLPVLQPGSTFKVTLDETGNPHKAVIVRLGGKVDPVSQTIKAYGRITDNTAELLPGMSGAIELTRIK